MSSLIFTFLYKYAQHMLVHFAPNISQSLHIKLKQNVYLEITRIFLYFLPGMARNSLHRYTCIYIYMAEYIYSYTNILHRQPLHILKILINSGFGILINVHIYICTNISFRSFSRFFVTCMIVKVFKGLGMTKIIDLLL